MIEFNNKKLVLSQLGDRGFQEIYLGDKLLWTKGAIGLEVAGTIGVRQPAINDNQYYFYVNGKKVIFPHTDYPFDGYGDFDYIDEKTLWKYGNNNGSWFTSYLQTLTKLKGFPVTEDLSNVFAECVSLSDIPAISDIDVSKTKNFSGMFQNCGSLRNIDLSSWSINVAPADVNFSNMFNGCINLESINLSSWTAESMGISLSGGVNGYGNNKSNITDMFKNCTNLKTVYIKAKSGNMTSIRHSQVGEWIKQVCKDSGLQEPSVIDLGI